MQELNCWYKPLKKVDRENLVKDITQENFTCIPIIRDIHRTTFIHKTTLRASDKKSEYLSLMPGYSYPCIIAHTCNTYFTL